MNFTSLTFNLQNSPIRRETLQGRNYIVAPTAMLTEGVHTGSCGPLLYREAECKKAIPAWNMKPIIVYHPGQPVSACDPIILEKQQVGMLLNTRWKGKLRTEAWIDEERAKAVDLRVIDALEQNKMMEVSTGLFTDNGGGPGTWNGEEYVAEAVNHQPDHLALLPDKIGACSIADGAGMLCLNEAATAQGVDVTRLLVREMDTLRRMVGNAMSHGNLQTGLLTVLKERFGDTAWIIDVYDKFFVYDVAQPAISSGPSKMFRLGYTSSKDGSVEITGDPEEVVRVTEYRTPDGKFVGNEGDMMSEKTGMMSKEEKDKARAEWKKAHPDMKESEMPKNLMMNERSGKKMNKTELIGALITNKRTTWNEEDRSVLERLDESVLEKALPVADETLNTTATPPATDTPVTPPEPVTLEAYMAAAPPEFRGVLTNALMTHNQAKAALISAITANTKNVFTPEFLATKEIPELQGLAALAAVPVANDRPVPMFNGAFTPTGPVTNGASEESPLLSPVMNFEAKVA